MKIYHHNDSDGISSAAIVCKYVKEQALELDIKCISINYPTTINIEDININEIVYIVDYSIPPENMLELLSKTNSVTWIDHHKTAIEKYKDFSLEIKGIRNTKDAACELTWKYLYPDKQMPLAIQLIGDYDNWKWLMGKLTNEFFCGVKLIGTNPMSSDWQGLLLEKSNLLSNILTDGQAISKYLKMDNRSTCLKVYERRFEGYKCAILNTNGKGSLTFESIDDGTYDILIVWQFTDKQFSLSLYTGKGKDIDVSLICKKYGGGGHKNASGMILTQEQMLKSGLF